MKIINDNVPVIVKISEYEFLHTLGINTNAKISSVTLNPGTFETSGVVTITLDCFVKVMSE